MTSLLRAVCWVFITRCGKALPWSQEGLVVVYSLVAAAGFQVRGGWCAGLLGWRRGEDLDPAAGLWFWLGLRSFLGFFLASVFVSHG